MADKIKMAAEMAAIWSKFAPERASFVQLRGGPWPPSLPDAPVWALGLTGTPVDWGEALGLCSFNGLLPGAPKILSAEEMCTLIKKREDEGFSFCASPEEVREVQGARTIAGIRAFNAEAQQRRRDEQDRNEDAKDWWKKFD